jgi:hypothetical protein
MPPAAAGGAGAAIVQHLGDGVQAGSSRLPDSFNGGEQVRRELIRTGSLRIAALGGSFINVALLDRLTHHVHILEMNGDSYRLKQSKQRQRQT